MSSTDLATNTRWMIRKDIPEIVFIEGTSQVDAFNMQQLVVCLAKRNVIGLVATTYDKNSSTEIILGYAIYETIKNIINIQRLGTHHLYRRKGVAKSLISRIVNKENHDINIILRETNLDAQLFFRSQKFKAVQVINKKFDDTQEDGYLMRYFN
jgi:ribosomal-protein-alanine N-acetyltransferase